MLPPLTLTTLGMTMPAAKKKATKKKATKPANPDDELVRMEVWGHHDGRILVRNKGFDAYAATDPDWKKGFCMVRLGDYRTSQNPFKNIQFYEDQDPVQTEQPNFNQVVANSPGPQQQPFQMGIGAPSMSEQAALPPQEFGNPMPQMEIPGGIPEADQPPRNVSLKDRLSDGVEVVE